MDRFSEILYDLGKEIGIDLYPDENRICQLNYDDSFPVQLQFDEVKNVLIIAAFVTEVPAGKFRESLFRATLIYNKEMERLGTFGYSEPNNMLVFFGNKKATGLSGEKAFQYVEKFIEEVKIWKEAIEGGKALPIVEGPQNNESPFGIK